jgi:hypothetical protein
MHWPDRSGVTGGFSVIDFGALFSQLLETCWWLLPLLILAALFKSARFKGFIGEVMVNMVVRTLWFIRQSCQWTRRYRPDPRLLGLTLAFLGLTLAFL